MGFADTDAAEMELAELDDAPMGGVGASCQISAQGTSDPRWQAVAEIVRSCNLELFDIEMPSGPGGVMRVFITAGNHEGVAKEVEISDCVRVSRLIAPLDEQGQVASSALVPDSVVLEVSSPGINRRLRRPEHFQSAVGQRIRITIDPAPIIDGRPTRTVLAQLVGASGAGADLSLSLIVPRSDPAKTTVKKGQRRKSIAELPHENINVRFNEIQSARVDFDFENVHVEPN